MSQLFYQSDQEVTTASESSSDNESECSTDILDLTESFDLTSNHSKSSFYDSQCSTPSLSSSPPTPHAELIKSELDRSSTPRILTLDQARIILNDEFDKKVEELVQSRLAEELAKLNISKTVRNARIPGLEDIITKNKDFLQSSHEDISNFVAICVFSAFGGRKGLDKYIYHFGYSRFKSTINHLNVPNRGGKLNTKKLCQIGHVILYYWTTLQHKEVKKRMISQFDGLTVFIGGRDRIVEEIGATNLWEVPKVGTSKVKAKIIEEIRQKFPVDEEGFANIMMSLGVAVP